MSLISELSYIINTSAARPVLIVLAEHHADKLHEELQEISTPVYETPHPARLMQWKFLGITIAVAPVGRLSYLWFSGSDNQGDVQLQALPF